MSNDDFFCSKCGAKLSNDNNRAVKINRRIIVSSLKGSNNIKGSLKSAVDYKRALKIAEENYKMENVESDLGFELHPLVELLNPFCWVAMRYRSKSRDALQAADLELAEEYKNKATLFSQIGVGLILGFVIIIIFIGIS